MENNPKKMRSNSIMIDHSKKEEFNILSGFRLLQKHIRNSWKIEVNKNNEITEETFDGCRIFILPCPRNKFSEDEFAAMRKYISSGGSLFVMLTEGGESSTHTNINYLLEEFGIVCNSDSVIRTIFHKYFNPKEAFVSNGVLNRAIVFKNREENSESRNHKQNEKFSDIEFERNVNVRSALKFVYPFGDTLSVNKSSSPILSTGTVCYPINRPVCAFHIPQKEGAGRVAVVGSVHMFTDEYFGKEENAKIFDIIIKFLTDGLTLNNIDSSNPNILEAHAIPDNIELSGKLKMCLQEDEIEHAIFGDFAKIFENSLRSIGLDNWPEAIRIYEKIGLKHEPLSLVSPAFHVPMPAFHPAIFPPRFRELPPPELELFDLDDAFSSNEAQLAQLTNRSAEDELDLYIRQVGEIIGVNKMLFANNEAGRQQSESKKIIEHIIQQVIEWKKSSVDHNEINGGAEILQDEEDQSQLRNMAVDEQEEDDDIADFLDIDQYDDQY